MMILMITFLNYYWKKYPKDKIVKIIQDQKNLSKLELFLSLEDKEKNIDDVSNTSKEFIAKYLIKNISYKQKYNKLLNFCINSEYE